jgi:hypothetical protein
MKLQFKGDALFFGPALLIPCRPAGVSVSQWDNLKGWIEEIPEDETPEDFATEEYERGFVDGEQQATDAGSYNEGYEKGFANGAASVRTQIVPTSTAPPKKRKKASA